MSDNFFTEGKWNEHDGLMSVNLSWKGLIWMDSDMICVRNGLLILFRFSGAGYQRGGS